MESQQPKRAYEAASGCQHENFYVNAEVARLTESEGGPVKCFTVDLHVKCMDCELPFEWVGFEGRVGWMSGEPMVSPDAQELRVPIRPKGSDILPALPGFTIKAS